MGLIVEELLKDESGHPIDDCNSALFFAAGLGSNKIVELLLTHNQEIPLDVGDSKQNTILHQAINGSDARVLSKLLERVPSYVERSNDMGQTPLHRAAEIGNLAMVEILLNMKAGIKQLTVSGETPFLLAVREGHHRVALKLMDVMDDVEERTAYGETALGLAVGQGHSPLVRDIFGRAPDLGVPFHSTTILENKKVLQDLLKYDKWNMNEKVEESGKNPLHLAVELELPGAVESLIEAGADLNPKDDSKRTPLHLAAEVGSVQVVEMLYKAGADLNATDEEKKTPLYLAAAMNRPQIIEFLLERNADANLQVRDNRTALFEASFQGNIEAVTVLLKEGRKWNIKVDLANERGWTPLHAAYDQPDITKMLLKNGADPEQVTSSSNSTALAMASFWDESLEVVRYHLEFKANPNNPDIDGETAVHRSVLGGSLRVLQLLIDHSAQLNVPRKDKSTPLHLAASEGSREDIADLLLDKNVDLNGKSEAHGTILMAAASGGLIRIAERVIKKGVDVNEICYVPQMYHTALQAAAYHGQLDMVKWLLSKEIGAHADHPGEKQGNALWAAMNGKSTMVTSIVKELISAGADIHYHADEGDSALTMAVDLGLHEVVELFLDRLEDHVEATSTRNPADTSYKDKFGRSLLSRSILAKQKSVFDCLLKRENTNINDTDNAGRTPLILAVLSQAGDKYIAGLVSKTCDINFMDLEGKTALIYACILDQITSVQALLDAEASTCTIDCRKRGPLYWACRRSSMEVLRLVSKALRREYPEKLASHCWGALSAAVASNRPSFLHHLLVEIDEPASENMWSDGWTPMYTAQRYGLDSIRSSLEGLSFDADDVKKLSRPRLPSAWNHEDRTPSLLVQANLVTVERE
ncbi:hypothetical protein SLS63_013162 [Diaporthe eres]|uniref:Uncharacterized protein n=1 Tax=Diaporthe eres TaxID=83184 RepID=A0ABR1NP97_DIAER